jgi:hypothetical protein
MQTTIAITMRDERGIVLPTAMIMLAILMALTFAFTSLATTEPMIGRNHSMYAQARSHAESGIERAMWAMTNAGLVFSAGVAPAPYNGSQFVTVSANGGFTVRVTDGAVSNEKLAVSIGWAPDQTGQLRAARRIQATLMKHAFSQWNHPCALCVRGALDVGGNATITAEPGDTGVRMCSGYAPAGGTISTGTTEVRGSGDVNGPNPAITTDDTVENYAGTLPQLTTDDLHALRAIAKATPGAYRTGSVTFNDSDPLPANAGIVFVDTTTGADLRTTPTMTPTSEMANVQITGNQTWSGWLIVMGDLQVNGTVNLTGTLYARNDFVFNGNGTITGVVYTDNKLGTMRSSVDASTTGSSMLRYDCVAARDPGGRVATGWFMKPGTFREVEGVTHTYVTN